MHWLKACCFDSGPAVVWSLCFPAVVLSILIASTATWWTLHKLRRLSSRSPAEPRRTSATPPSSSNRRNRRAGRTRKRLNTHVCVVTQTTDSSDLWLWHWSRCDKQTAMKEKLYFGTTYHNNTTEVSVYAACMSCHQIIFFWSLLRRRLQAASDDVVYSSVSSRGWIAALSLPPSTNQLQEAVSCGSLCKSVWWSCGSTLTLYRTIKKLQRDEPKVYLQLCGGSHECSSVQTGTLSISGITHNRIICFWAMICSTLSLLFHFIIFSVIWKLVWNSSLSEGPSTLLLTALIKPGRGKMQQCRLYTLQSLSCFSLIRLFWEQKLKLYVAEPQPSSCPPHAAWSEPSDLHTIHFYFTLRVRKLHWSQACITATQFIWSFIVSVTVTHLKH